MAKTKTVTKKKSVAKPATKKAAATKKVKTKKVAPAKKTVKKVTAVAPKKQVKAATKKVATKVVETAKKPTIAEKIQVAAKPKIAISKNIKHIAIAGNIGSGKTTLTQQLAKHYGWLPQFEDVENNPYLNDFYEDMPRWSFNLQIFFLNSRLNQLLEIQRGTETIIQDRTIYEDANIFAPNLHDMGLMGKRDFDNYYRFFETLKSMVQPPDLLIYLKASVPTLVGQIQKRGREYEENIRLDYLKKLNELYNNWIENYKEGPLLIIDADVNKFAENEEHLGQIISKVDSTLFGLF